MTRPFIAEYLDRRLAKIPNQRWVFDFNNAVLNFSPQDPRSMQDWIDPLVFYGFYEDFDAMASIVFRVHEDVASSRTSEWMECILFYAVAMCKISIVKACISRNVAFTGGFLPPAWSSAFASMHLTHPFCAVDLLVCKFVGVFKLASSQVYELFDLMLEYPQFRCPANDDHQGMAVTALVLSGQALTREPAKMMYYLIKFGLVSPKAEEILAESVVGSCIEYVEGARKMIAEEGKS